jgi:hypothetical protein
MLNDPFEFSPGIDDNVAPDQIRRALDHPEVAAQFLGRTGHMPNAVAVAKLKSKMPEIAKNTRRKWAQIVSDFRVFTMSRRDDGILLWAHYAAAHRGFAVGFRTDTLHEIYGTGRVIVSYEKERVSFGSPMELIPHPNPDHLYRVLAVKSPEWEYEEEVRIISEKSFLQEDNGRLYMPLPANAIDSVIFGSRCEVEREIKAALSADTSLAHVKQLRAVLDQHRFQIRIEPEGAKRAPS